MATTDPTAVIPVSLPPVPVPVVPVAPPPVTPVAPPVAPVAPAAVPPVLQSNWDPQGAALAASRRLAAGAYAPVQNQSIPLSGRALLATIGGKDFESNGSYTQRFNQPDFTDFSKHPATLGDIKGGPNRGKKSDAAGRYQFLSTTWADQAKKLGLKEFSPASQDAAAWNLAKETYAAKSKGRDLAEDLNDPKKLPKIVSALRSQWTSLPGGIEQRRAYNSFLRGYQTALNAEMGRTTPATQVAGPGAPGTVVGARPGVGILTSDNWARGALPATGQINAVPPPPAGVQIARNPLYTNPRSPT